MSWQPTLPRITADERGAEQRCCLRLRQHGFRGQPTGETTIGMVYYCYLYPSRSSSTVLLLLYSTTAGNIIEGRDSVDKLIVCLRPLSINA
jgi:hypothetical protein